MKKELALIAAAGFLSMASGGPASASAETASGSTTTELVVIGTGFVETPADTVTIQTVVDKKRVADLRSELARFDVLASDLKVSEGFGWLANEAAQFSDQQAETTLTVSTSEKTADPSSNMRVLWIKVRNLARLNDIKKAIRGRDGQPIMTAAPSLNDDSQAAKSATEIAIKNAWQKAKGLYGVLNAQSAILSKIDLTCQVMQRENLLQALEAVGQLSGEQTTDPVTVRTTATVCATFLVQSAATR